jgi:hypothetical protein
MADLVVDTSVRARLDWTYDPREPRLRALYEKAKQAQWNATTDISWDTEVPFGQPLPDDSGYAMASFAASPLHRFGRAMWDRFRWELQCWMVSQFLHGEQGALVVAGRLVEVVPDLDSKVYAASQAADEARHVEVFSRYLREKVPEQYPVSPPLAALLTDILADRRWDVTALGMQIMVEALAMAAFRLADRTFHDDLITQITRLVARDEARHVSFGVMSLSGIYRELSRAELADREEMVLEAAHLTRQRFMLEEVWERLGVPRRDGVEFARSDAMMVRYRHTIFAKVVSVLSGIGLLTDRVRAGLSGLDLLSDVAAARSTGANPHSFSSVDPRARLFGQEYE